MTVEQKSQCRTDDGLSNSSVAGTIDLGMLSTLAPVLGKIYREPEIQGIPKIIEQLGEKLSKEENPILQLVGKQTHASSCGGDLGIVIVIVMIVGPAPGPTVVAQPGTQG